MRASVASMVIALLCACTGGETGNPVIPNDSIEIALTARSTDPDLVAISEGTEGTRIEEAWVAFGAIEFLGDADCARFGELDSDGTTELVANLAEPGAYIELDTAPERYCGLIVPLPPNSRNLPEGAPEELRSHSVVLRGTRADGVQFVLSHPEQDELELAALDGDIELDERGFVLVFDAAAWMDGVDLDEAELRDDGTIRIDADENVGLLQQFEANLECSLELYIDADEDGALSGGDPHVGSCAPE